MQRIIINEIDNTSNIEALSSYDVVYVPGFSNNNESPFYHQGTSEADSRPSYFRNPTLCTSRFDFLSKFGDQGSDNSQAPTFSNDQPYPIATADKRGFPSYAIPNFVEEDDNPTAVEGLNTFSFDAGTGREDVVSAIVEGGVYIYVDTTVSGWQPEEGKTYYMANVASSGDVDVYTMSKLASSASYADAIVFTSSVTPVTEQWKELVEGNYVYTQDTEIGFSGDVVKTYYKSASKLSVMFYGPSSERATGDADPGYRYALYLLSLGIPVYYEQMNSAIEEITDIHNPEYLNANPAKEGWYIQVGEHFVKTADTEVQEGTTYYAGADMSVESMYKGLELRFETDLGESDYSFDTIGDYSVKYITTGGYPVYEYGNLTSENYGSSPIAEAMIRLAANRSDALALIDHTNNPQRSIYETDLYSVIHRVRNDEISQLDKVVGSYGAMFTPWYECTNANITGGTSNGYQGQMPASLAFLSALAQQVKNFNPWLAVSGVSRGPVPYCSSLHTNNTLTNNVADSYQVIPGDTATENTNISINPITYIRNYGYCIWGNRTLRNNASGTQATSFLNIRNLVSDVKKTLYDASQQLMFEQNTDILWLNFKSKVTPLLETMVSNYILSDYKIVKYNVDPETGQPVPAYKVLAVIKIMPINSIEVFELQVQIENNEITTAEVE